MNLNKKLRTLILSLAFALALTGCTNTSFDTSLQNITTTEIAAEVTTEVTTEVAAGITTEGSTEISETETSLDDKTSSFDLSSVPEYSGEPYAVINDNIPFFTEDEITDVSYEYYSELDSLGRCGVTVASIGTDLMPTEERGEIGSVKPTGWHTVKYDFVDGKYLYNRCHLIGFQLTGENANPCNLITGTRYLNIEGQLPFENMVADYVKETNNHVMYRVTPIFEGDNLVASGVLMEGYSVEDSGSGICYCVYCYNVQPGVIIDYATGDSKEDDGSNAVTTETSTENTSGEDGSEETTYILNTNTKKFHLTNCSSVSDISESNKEEYTGTREELINKGYEPCKKCNP